MATSQKGKIQIELARTLTNYIAMTDSGDRQIFTAGTIWSGKDGYEPDVRPNGIVSGNNVISTHASDDTVTIAGFTAYSKGTLQTVAATSATVTRPGTASYNQIVSVTMASDGSIATVDGTAATAAFSTTRGADSGPPLISANSVEIGQIRLSSSTAAAIAASEIYQDRGTHAEFYDYPAWEESNLGDGAYADASDQKNSYIKFNEALPASHTASAAKNVYIKYYTPSFSTIAKTADFVPAETSVSKTSESYYEGPGGSGAIGSVKADSVGDATFTMMANDGVTDALLAEKNEVVTVKWYPNANKSPYMLTQGTLQVDRAFPMSGQNKINVTIGCENPSVEFSS